MGACEDEDIDDAWEYWGADAAEVEDVPMEEDRVEDWDDWRRI